MEGPLIIKKVEFENLYSTDYKDNCSERRALWFGIKLFFAIAVVRVLLEFFRWPLISAKEELPLIAANYLQLKS